MQPLPEVAKPLAELGGLATVHPKWAEDMVGVRNGAYMATARAIWETFLVMDGSNGGVGSVSRAVVASAWKFGEQVPSGKLEGLYPAYLLTGSNVVRRADCQVAPGEIAKHVLRQVGSQKAARALLKKVGPVAALETWLAAFLSQQPGDSVADIARGIIAAREVYGAGRRWQLLEENSSVQGVALSELYALSRQESNLGLCPAESTFQAGPLAIGEVNQGCRASKLPTPEHFIRPGWNFCVLMSKPGTHPRPEEPPVMPQRTGDPITRMYLAEARLVEEYGMDFAFHALSEYDELRWVMEEAEQEVDGGEHGVFLDDLSTLLSIFFDADARQEATRIVESLAKVLLLAGTGAKDIEILATAAKTSFAFYEAHEYGIASTPQKQPDIYLVEKENKEHENGVGSACCVRLQAAMYGACTRPLSLLCHADQGGDAAKKVAAMGPFGPHLAYLRYHGGEQLFVKVLGEAALRLEQIRDAWAANQDWAAAASEHGLHITLSEALRQASQYEPYTFRGVQTPLSDIHRSEPQAKHPVADDYWHHIGLIHQLNAGEDVSWAALDAGKMADKGFAAWQARNLAAAAAVRELLVKIAQQRLLPALAVALQFTPAATLVKLEVGRGHEEVMLNTQSFARLQEVFNAASSSAQGASLAR